MRPEIAATVKQLHGLRHEGSHILVVTLLRDRLEQLKNQLVDASPAEHPALQGRAQECRALLRQLTGEHPSKMA